MSAYKIQAQVNPLAATLTDAYTVPVGKMAIVNLTVTNRANAATAFRISLAVGGAADNLKQYIDYDTAINANTPIERKGISLAAGDVIRVYATLATLSFNLTGVEM